MITRLLFALAIISPAALGQVAVPASTRHMTFPDKHVAFNVYNRAPVPYVVQFDLAKRNDVHEQVNDGLAILYPKVARLEPGAKQKVSVTWRGDMTRSHYYLVRVNAIEENELTRDRSNGEHETNKFKVRIGQAFPLHIEAPQTRPKIEIGESEDSPILRNTGGRGDHIETLRLTSGQLVPVKKFLVPGQELPVGEFTGGQRIAAVKLRRFGWVMAGDQ